MPLKKDAELRQFSCYLLLLAAAGERKVIQMLNKFLTCSRRRSGKRQRNKKQKFNIEALAVPLVLPFQFFYSTECLRLSFYP